MARLDIVRLGHPALRTPADDVDPEEIAGDEFQQLVDDLLETMHDAGGVGLAAPQVGIAKQLFVYLALDSPPSASEGDAGADGESEEGPEEARANAEEKVLVNPALEPQPGDPVHDWEGCLSIPDLRGLVPRPPTVQVHALDRRGERIEFRASGYEARIIQHEFDHLNGIVFLDRMHDLRSLAFGPEWEEYMVESADEDAAVG